MDTMKTYDDIFADMQETYAQLAGFSCDEASDAGIRLRALAAQLETLYGELAELQRQVFPQTSTGVYLERHAQCRGLTRKAARAAAGILRFSRETPALTDIPISAGVACATRSSPQAQFVTTEDGLLPAGESYVDVPAQAVDPGRSGNVAAGAVCLLVGAAPGIGSVANPAPFAGGADDESDDALRERLLAGYRNISNGTNSAFYYDIAMQYEDVTSANVIPRARGRGTVDVVVCAASPDSAETLAALQDDLGSRREIGVDVQVLEAETLSANVVLRLAADSGYDHDDVASRCQAAAQSYLEALPVGEPLYRAQLIGRLLAVEGVQNLEISAPAADLRPGAYKVVRPGTVTAARMEVVG